MPIPLPKFEEKQDKYIPRCIEFLTDENKEREEKDRRPPEQIQAICYGTWREAKGIKKWFCPNCGLEHSMIPDSDVSSYVCTKCQTRLI